MLVNAGTDDLSAANLLILTNKYYEQIVGRIISETAGARWQFGDMNYTAFPTFTASMVAGTQSYDLRDFLTAEDSGSTSANSFPLTIMGVEVMDSGGIWHPLSRITLKEITEGQAEYQKTNGLPKEYEVRDNLIVLYPAPSAAATTLTTGLKLHYLRSADTFTTAEFTAGTKEPGFPSPWHDMLAYGPAFDYETSQGKPNADRFLREFNRRMDEMLDFISRRDQDTDYRITGDYKSYR